MTRASRLVHPCWSLSSNYMSNETEKKPKKSLTPSEVPFTSPEILSRYVTDTGKILPRRITGLSAKDQRAITKQIKRARNMLLMQ